jgi:serine/threonine-protein kinase
MTLAPGTRIGPYRTMSRIGAGAMGEVYRAHDTKLGRDVALKVLPAAFAHDPDRLARFQREAELLAALNHPHIAHIYDLEEKDGIKALVMEFIDGPTLAERIGEGPIPLDEALLIAKQIAEALDAAHQQGIVHRDLKPANIKVTAEGVVKVLDFGLAKVFKPAAVPAYTSTVTSPSMITQHGVALGTVAYMAPEQAKGRPVDKRADIWAFGVVLFEIVTGTPLFARDGLNETFASILREHPDVSAAPPEVRRLLLRCLEKDPHRRLRDIGDAWDLLEAPGASGIPGESARGMRERRLLWVGGLVMAAALAALTIWVAVASPGTAAPRVTRFVETLPEGRTMPRATGLGTAVALSQDARTIVYRVQEYGRYRLYRRFMDQTHTEPIGEADAAEPFFSPDGQWLAFRSGTTLKRVPVGGGPAHAIAELPRPAFRGASWSADGTIILGGLSEGLWRFAETGGELTTLAKPVAGRSVSFPQLLPGGQAVLYTERSQFEADDALFVLDLRTGQSRRLFTGVAGRYLPSGHLVFASADKLWAVRFDAQRLNAEGTPVPVLDDIRIEAGGDGPAALVNMAVASTGAVVYVSETSSDQRTLVWVDRQGREQPIGDEARAFANPRVSPDGTRIAVNLLTEGGDIWIWDIARRTLRQLTTDAPPNWIAAWFPDGQRLAFSARHNGVFQVHWQAADGSGVPQPLTEGPQNKSPDSISRDGRLLLLTQHHPTQTDTVVLPLDNPKAAKKLRETPEGERNPTLSPDGRWLAYESNRSGTPEIYVRPFPNVDHGEFKVTSDGGAAPVWARDGRELFYWKASGLMVSIMAVTILPGPRFDFGAPRRVVQGRYAHPGLDTQYDVAPDGRVVLSKPVAASSRDEIVIVLNWFDELRRLVPVAD